MLLALIMMALPPVGSGAEAAVVVPQLSKLESFAPFLDRAAEKNALFRRESWREVIHPLVPVDFSRPDSMIDAGIDPKGAGSLWTEGPTTFVCVELADPKKFEEKAKAKLKTLGNDWRETSSGLTVVGAKDAIDRVMAGYVIKGRLSCAASAQGQSAEKPLAALAKLMASGAGAKGFGGVKGDALVRSGGVTTGLKASGLTSEGELRSAVLPWGKLTAGASPYAELKAPGLAVLKLRIDPAQLTQLDPRMMGDLATAMNLPLPALQQAASALAAQLNGNLVLLVSRVEVRGSLRTAQGRFYSLRQAWLAEAKDADAAKALETQLASTPGAVPDGDGYSLRSGLRAGVKGTHLWFTDDAETLKTLLAALPDKPGTQKHGLELEVDPKLLARALAQVPLLDAVSDPNLAGLLAAGSEMGPLLQVTQRLGFVADGDKGAHSGHFVWTLTPGEAKDGGK